MWYDIMGEVHHVPYFVEGQWKLFPPKVGDGLNGDDLHGIETWNIAQKKTNLVGGFNPFEKY